MSKLFKLFAITVLAALSTSYAIADAQANAFEPIFKHSRDSREFRYQQQPHSATTPHITRAYHAFQQSRDSREFSYQRQSHTSTRSQAKQPRPVFTYTRDSREFNYLK